MRQICGSGCGYVGKVSLFAGVAILSCVELLAQAHSPQARSPKYDPATEIKMKGVVEELKFPPKGQEKEAAHLLMKNGEAMIDIYLCPKAFMDDMGITFSKGDEIAFTGSKVKQEGADLMLAREVKKGQDTLVLRDDKGNPVWNWGHH